MGLSRAVYGSLLDASLLLISAGPGAHPGAAGERHQRRRGEIHAAAAPRYSFPTFVVTFVVLWSFCGFGDKLMEMDRESRD
jgi:hypothetical protein